MNTPLRVALITGGNRGIGFATAQHLAAQGVMVILGARDQQRGTASAERIRMTTPGANVSVMHLDLASLASIRAFADRYRASGFPLHILINNAAVVGLGKEMLFTADGFEIQFGTSHLGHFLLTNLLLPIITASAPARVITVSSIRHFPRRFPKGGPDFDYDNLMGQKYYNNMTFYDNVKLANIWFAYELQRRLAGTGITSVAVCPGFVPETIAMSRQGLARWFYRDALQLIPGARPATTSGAEIAQLATDPQLAGVGGKFYHNGAELRSSAESYDLARAQQLWAFSAQITGL